MTEKVSERPVGFGCPPMHTRFREGQSGNPKGRPKEEINLVASYVGILDRKVTTTSGKTFSARELGLRAMVNDALKCKSRAFAQFLRLAERAGSLKPIETPSQTYGVHYILRSTGHLVPAAQYHRDLQQRKEDDSPTKNI